MRLAFGDALHLGGVDAVELALLVALLEIEPFGQGEQSSSVSTLDVADDSAEDGVQLAGTTSRPSELPGPGIFVHHTGIAGNGYKSLDEGAKVSYEESQGRKGLQADNVSRL
jgi:cold shock CspA family protein